MSSNGKCLGRLERIDLRGIWEKEDDFTRWLAKEENLALLGNAIGIEIELELEAQEKSVGPFRADILCKDTDTNGWVLVENQLECTDHTHLGQLLTYAAGLKAKAVVWLARQFTEEHRAALDWLNENAGESVSFFGVEIELWRIADSRVAPKFNVVCRPNVYPTDIRKVAEGALSDTQLLQRDYWTGLRNVLVERGSIVRPRTPQPGKWTNFSIGRSNFGLYAGIGRQQQTISVGVELQHPNAEACLKVLKESKDIIEREVGCNLQWDGGTNNRNKYIYLYKEGVDPTDRNDWPSQTRMACRRA